MEEMAAHTDFSTSDQYDIFVLQQTTRKNIAASLGYVLEQENDTDAYEATRESQMNHDK